MKLVDAKGGVAGATPASADRADSGSGKPPRLDAAAIAAKFTELKSSPKGLTSAEAQARIAKDGPNAIVNRN